MKSHRKLFTLIVLALTLTSMILFQFNFISPVYATEGTFYSTTADGYVGLSGSDWYTIVAASTGDTVSHTTTSTSLRAWSDGSKTLYRFFYYFDTSQLPDDANISSVVFRFYVESGASYYRYVCAMKGTQADTLTTADFDSFTGSSYGTAYITSSDAAYYNVTFNAQGVSDVVKDGITKVCLRDYTYDYGNTTFSNQLDADIRFTEYSGTTYDPVLIITYTAEEDTTPPTYSAVSAKTTPYFPDFIGAG